MESPVHLFFTCGNSVVLVPVPRQHRSVVMEHDLTHYLADSPPTIVRLEIEKHFDALDDQHKRYAHHISRYDTLPNIRLNLIITKDPSASHLGTRIVLRQTSPESEPTFDFILALYKSCNGDWQALRTKSGVSEDELTYFLQYATQFLGNTGNYKSFGDSKFIPRCSEAVFTALAATCPEAEAYYKAANGGIFSAEHQSLLHLGYRDAGHMTTYYPESPNITQNEIEAVTAWMGKVGLLPENTRLKKTADENFQILIASAANPSEGGDLGKETKFTIEDGILAGKTIELVYGDYAVEMGAITKEIKAAADNAANENQKKMHQAYAQSFRDGSLKAFKESQKFWINDKGPMVESNIGFTETYRDPAGIRGEWEGFAAVVSCTFCQNVSH